MLYSVQNSIAASPARNDDFFFFTDYQKPMPGCQSWTADDSPPPSRAVNDQLSIASKLLILYIKLLSIGKG